MYFDLMERCFIVMKIIVVNVDSCQDVNMFQMKHAVTHLTQHLTSGIMAQSVPLFKSVALTIAERVH